MLASSILIFCMSLLLLLLLLKHNYNYHRFVPYKYDAKLHLIKTAVKISYPTQLFFQELYHKYVTNIYINKQLAHRIVWVNALPFVPEETSLASEGVTPLREQSKFTMLHFIWSITSVRFLLLQEKHFNIIFVSNVAVESQHLCLIFERY